MQITTAIQRRRVFVVFFGGVSFGLLLVAFLLGPGLFSPVAARPVPQGSGFLPVDNWAVAVESGDPDEIKAFYVFGIGSFAKTPQYSERTPPDAGAEETAYWSTLHNYGLVSVMPKILEQTSPKPGQVRVVLRVELTFVTPAEQGAAPEEQHALASVAQTWTRQSNGEWLISATERGDIGAMPKITLPQPKIPNTHLYPDPGKAKADLVAAIASARADHKRVLVVFGANWCYDCHVLDATLRSPRVAPLVTANFHVVHVNIGDGDANSDLASRFQVPLNKGIPSLAVLDPTGKLITSQKNGEFESAAKIGMSDVLGFLNRWKPPARTHA